MYTYHLSFSSLSLSLLSLVVETKQAESVYNKDGTPAPPHAASDNEKKL